MGLIRCVGAGVLAGALALAGCSDDVTGKTNGEPCVAHEECASKLCTIPALDGGLKDGGLPAKRCMEPGLTP